MSTVDKQNISLTQGYCGVLPVGVLLLLCLVGLVVSLQFPDIGRHLVCSQENLLSMRLHTLITYAIWPLSTEHLVTVAVSLLLSVYFIGALVTQKCIWFLILGSAVLGALLFCVLVEPPAMLVGGVMVSWGLAGVVLALGFTKWRHLGVVRRAYLFLVWLFTLAVVFSFTAMGYVQLLVAAAAFASVCFWHRRDRSKSEATPPNRQG